MGELFGSSVKSLLQQDPPRLPNEAELLDAVVQKVGPFADRSKLCYHIRVSAGKVHWAVNSYFRSILASAWPAREDFDSKVISSQQATAISSAAAAPSKASLSGVPADAVKEPAAASMQPQTAQAAAVPNGMPEQHAVSVSRSSPCSPTRHAHPSAGASSSSELRQPQLSLLGAAAVRQCCAVAEAAAAHAGAGADAAAAPMHLDMLPGNALECVLSLLDLLSLLNAAASCKALHRAAQADQLWQQLFLQRWGAVIFPVSKHSSMMSRRAHAVLGRPTVYGGNISVGAGTFGVGAAAAAAAAQGRHGCAGDNGSELHPHPAAAAAEAAAEDAAQAGSGSSSMIGRSHRPQVPAGDSSSNACVTRCTGSCLAITDPVQAAAAAASSGSMLQAVQPLPSLQRQQQQLLKHPYTPPAAARSSRSLQQLGPAACTTGTSQHSWGCSCSRPCTSLAMAAPCGSWRLQYQQQHGYQSVRRCPKCGDATVVPIVYGFPSAPLLAGMGVKRLVLGGDHLIDSCHVWGCSGCRSCYRFFPYADVQLWLQDDEAQQRLDQARAAASRSSGRRVGGGGAATDGGASSQQEGGEAGDMALDDAAAAAAGFPRYTYEL